MGGELGTISECSKHNIVIYEYVLTAYAWPAARATRAIRIGNQAVPRNPNRIVQFRFLDGSVLRVLKMRLNGVRAIRFQSGSIAARNRLVEAVILVATGILAAEPNLANRTLRSRRYPVRHGLGQRLEK